MGMKPVQTNLIMMLNSHRRDGLLCAGVRYTSAEEILGKAGLMSPRERGPSVVEYHHADQAKAVLRLNGFEVEE